jgi:hypothetical protein
VLLASGVMALPVFGLTLLMPIISEQAELLVRLREALLLAGVASIGAACFVAALRLTGGLDPLDREQLAKTKLPLKKWILRIL